MVRQHLALITLAVCLFMSVSFSDETFDNLVKAGKYREAIDYADNIPANKRDAAFWVQLAQANEKVGLTEKALACYMVSSRLHPTDYTSLLGAARIYNKLDQAENAMNMARKALEQNFSGEASWEFARAAIKLERPDEAKQALEKVIETDPANVVANRELGLIYYKDKQYAKALPLLKRSMETKEDADVAYMIGKCYLETKDVDNAVTYLKKTTEQKPTMYEAGLDLARAYFGMGKYLVAASEYGRVNGKITFEAEDYYNQAVAYDRSGKADKAIAAYKQAISAYGKATGSEAITARLKVGKNLLATKNYSAAQKHFEFIEKADPNAATVNDIYFLLADAYQGSNNSEKAISSLEKAIELDGNNIEAYARLADLYEKNNMESKAKQTYEKMMSLSPNDPKVYLILGQYNLKAKKYAEALELLVKSNALEKNPVTLESIAICASELQQWGKARDASESAIAMDPKRKDARIILYTVFKRDKNYPEMKKHLEVLIQSDPNNIEYLKDLATACDKTNDQEKLIQTDKKIIKLDKGNVESRHRLASHAMSQKNTDRAYELFKELSSLEPKNEEVFKNLYELARKKKEIPSAISYLRSYLKLNSRDAEAQRDLGDLLYERKELDGALEAYRQAIKLNPNIKGFYKRYAEIVIAKGQQDEVITALTGVIESGEADFGTYSTLGMMYHKKGQYDKSIDMYQKALQLEPQNTEALVALADAQAAGGDVSAAVITYEQSVMMNPNASEEYKSLGDLYVRQKNVSQAMGAYQKYLDKASSPDSEIAMKIATYNFNNKKYVEASKYFAMITGKKAADFNMLLMYGEALFKSEKYKKAIEIFDGLLSRNPKVSTKREIIGMLAEAYEKDGNTAKAVQTYKTYISLAGVNDPEAAYKAAFLQEKSNKSSAIQIYESNVKKYPNDYRNFLRLGLLYAEKKQTLTKAGPLLKKAASLADSLPSVWQDIAQVYGKLGKVDEELDAYMKYLKKDPQNLEANIRVGTILMEREKYTDAMIYLETANTLSTNNVKVIEPLALGYVKTNRMQEALGLLNAAKKLKPSDPDIRRQLYKVYMETGEKKKAIAEIEELIELKRDNKTLLLYAQLLMEERKFKDAENAIEDIRATDPTNIDALMTLAMVQRARKKYDDAIETYKEIIYIKGDYVPAVYERAETYMLQNEVLWAQRFYERTLRTDPDYALAELGLAKIAKMRKDKAKYVEHLEKAYKLDPNNKIIKAEYSKAKK
ncbi:MAG: tetratricopeptide repeat protein [Chitinivibrionales bacterium]